MSEPTTAPSGFDPSLFADTPAPAGGFDETLFESPALTQVDESLFETPVAPDKPFFSFSDTVSGIWDAVSGLGATAPAAFYQLTEGLERPDQYSDNAKAAFAKADAYNAEMQAKTAANLAAGESTSVGESFREAGGSLAFSLGSMAAALPAMLAGGKAGALTGASVAAAAGFAGPQALAPEELVTVPVGSVVGGLIGGGIAAGSAAGTAAYRMAGASFLNESFQKLNAESMAKSGRVMNEAERKSAYDALLPIAKNTALWEAGPEAVSSAVTLGAGKIIFGLGKGLETAFAKSLTKAITPLGVKVAAGAGDLVVELGTETLTQVEQSADQRKADLIAQGKDPAEARADWSPSGLTDAFQQVAPQTLALLGLMGGAGGVVKASANLVTKLRAANLPQTADQVETLDVSMDAAPLTLTAAERAAAPVVPTPGTTTVAMPSSRADAPVTLPSSGPEAAAAIFGPAEDQREYLPDLQASDFSLRPSLNPAEQDKDVVWWSDGKTRQPTARVFNHATGAFEPMSPVTTKLYAGKDVVSAIKKPSTLTRGVVANESPAAPAPAAVPTPAIPGPSGNTEFDTAFPAADMSFDPAAHVYTVAGREVPSVTALKGAHPKFFFDSKARLAKTAAKLGQTVEQVRALWDDKRDKGSLFHDKISKVLKDPSVPVPVFVQRMVAAITAGQSGTVVSERPVWTENYAGTIDALVPLQDGSYRLVDFKTLDDNPHDPASKANTRYQDKPSKVDDWRLQLEAYKRALEAKGLRVSETLVIPINRANNHAFEDAAGNIFVNVSATQETEALFTEIFQSSPPATPPADEKEAETKNKADAEGQGLLTPEPAAAVPAAAPAASTSASTRPLSSADQADAATRELLATAGHDGAVIHAALRGTPEAAAALAELPAGLSPQQQGEALVEAALNGEVEAAKALEQLAPEGRAELQKAVEAVRAHGRGDQAGKDMDARLAQLKLAAPAAEPLAPDKREPGRVNFAQKALQNALKTDEDGSVYLEEEELQIGNLVTGSDDSGTKVSSAYVVTGSLPLKNGAFRHRLVPVDLRNRPEARLSLSRAVASYAPNAGVVASSSKLLAQIQSALRDGSFSSHQVGIKGALRKLITRQLKALGGYAFLDDARFIDTGDSAMEAFIEDGVPVLEVNLGFYLGRLQDLVQSIDPQNTVGLDALARDFAHELAQTLYEEMEHKVGTAAIPETEMAGVMEEVYALTQTNAQAREEFLKHARWRRGAGQFKAAAPQAASSASDAEVLALFGKDSPLAPEVLQQEFAAVGYEMLASLRARLRTGSDTASARSQVQAWAKSLAPGTDSSKLGTLARRLVEMANRYLEAIGRLLGAIRMVEVLPPRVGQLLDRIEEVMAEGGFNAPDVFNIHEQATAQLSGVLSQTGRLGKDGLAHAKAQKELRQEVARLRDLHNNPSFLPVSLSLDGQLVTDSSLGKKYRDKLQPMLDALNTEQRAATTVKLLRAAKDLDWVLRYRNQGVAPVGLRPAADSRGKGKLVMATNLAPLRSEFLRAIEAAANLSADELTLRVNNVMADMLSEPDFLPVANYDQRLGELLKATRGGGLALRAQKEARDALLAFDARSFQGSMLSPAVPFQAAAMAFTKIPQADPTVREAMDIAEEKRIKAYEDAREAFAQSLAQTRKELAALAGTNAEVARLVAARDTARAEADIRFRERQQALAPVPTLQALINRLSQHPALTSQALFKALPHGNAGAVEAELSRAARTFAAAVRLRDFRDEFEWLVLGGQMPRSLRQRSQRWTPVNLVGAEGGTLMPFASIRALTTMSPGPFGEPGEEVLNVGDISGSVSLPSTHGVLKFSYAPSNAHFQADGVPYEQRGKELRLAEPHYGVVIHAMQLETLEGSKNSSRLLGVEPRSFPKDADGWTLHSADKTDLLRANARTIQQQLSFNLSEARWRNRAGVNEETVMSGGFSLPYSKDEKGNITMLMNEQAIVAPSFDNVNWSGSGSDTFFSAMDTGVVGNLLLGVADFTARAADRHPGHSPPLLSHEGGLTPAGLVYQLVGPKLLEFLALTKHLHGREKLPDGTFREFGVMERIIASVENREGLRALYDSLAPSFHASGQNEFGPERERLAGWTAHLAGYFWDLNQMASVGNHVYAEALRSAQDNFRDRRELAESTADLPVNIPGLKNTAFAVSIRARVAKPAKAAGAYISLLTPARASKGLDQYSQIYNLEAEEVWKDEGDEQVLVPQDGDVNDDGVIKRSDVNSSREAAILRGRQLIRDKQDSWRGEWLMALLGGDLDRVVDFIHDPRFTSMEKDAGGVSRLVYHTELIDAAILDHLERLAQEERARGIVVASRGERLAGSPYDDALRKLRDNHPDHEAVISSLLETGGEVQMNHEQAGILDAESFEADTHTLMQAVAGLIPGLAIIHGNASWEGSQDTEDGKPVKPPVAFIPDPFAPVLALPYGSRVQASEPVAREALVSMLEWLGSHGGVDLVGQASRIVAVMAKPDGLNPELKAALRDRLTQARRDQGARITEHEDARIAALATAWTEVVRGGVDEALSKVDDPAAYLLDPRQKNQKLTPAQAARVIALALTQPFARKALVLSMSRNPGSLLPTPAQIAQRGDLIGLGRLPGIGELMLADQMSELGDEFKVVDRSGIEMSPDDEDFQQAAMRHAVEVELAMRGRTGDSEVEDALENLSEMGASPLATIQAEWAALLLHSVLDAMTPKFAPSIDERMRIEHAERLANPVADSPFDDPKPSRWRNMGTPPPGLFTNDVRFERKLTEAEARQLLAVVSKDALRELMDKHEVSSAPLLQWLAPEEGQMTADQLMAASGAAADLLRLEYSRIISFQKGDHTEDQASNYRSYSFASSLDYEAWRNDIWHDSRVIKGMTAKAESLVANPELGLVVAMGESGYSKVVLLTDIEAIRKTEAAAGRTLLVEVPVLRDGKRVALVNGVEVVVEDGATQVPNPKFVRAIKGGLVNETKFARKGGKLVKTLDRLVRERDPLATEGVEPEFLPITTFVTEKIDALTYEQRKLAREQVEHEIWKIGLTADLVRGQDETANLELSLAELANIEPQLLGARSAAAALQALRDGSYLNVAGGGLLDVSPLIRQSFDSAAELRLAMAREVVVNFEDGFGGFERSVSLKRMLGQQADRADNPWSAERPAAAQDKNPLIIQLEEVEARLKQAEKAAKKQRAAMQKVVLSERAAYEQELLTARTAVEEYLRQRNPWTTSSASAPVLPAQAEVDAARAAFDARLAAIDASPQLAPSQPVTPARLTRYAKRLLGLSTLESELAGLGATHLERLAETEAKLLNLPSAIASMEAELADPLTGDVEALDAFQDMRLGLLDEARLELERARKAFNAQLKQAAAYANRRIPNVLAPATLTLNAKLDNHTAKIARFRQWLLDLQSREALHELGKQAYAITAARQAQFYDPSFGLHAMDHSMLARDSRIEIPTEAVEALGVALANSAPENRVAAVEAVLAGHVLTGEGDARSAISALREYLSKSLDNRLGVNPAAVFEVFRLASELPEMKNFEAPARHRMVSETVRAVMEGRLALEGMEVERRMRALVKGEAAYQHRKHQLYAPRADGLPSLLELKGKPDDVLVVRRWLQRHGNVWSANQQQLAGSGRHLDGFNRALDAASGADALMDLGAEALGMVKGKDYHVVDGVVRPVALTQVRLAAPMYPPVVPSPSSVTNAEQLMAGLEKARVFDHLSSKSAVVAARIKKQSAAMGVFDPIESLKASTLARLTLLVAAHESKAFVDVGREYDPIAMTYGDSLHQRITKLLGGLAGTPTPAALSELQPLHAELKARILADKALTEVVGGFVPGEFFSRPMIKGLLNHDPFIRTVFSGSAESQSHAREAIALIAYGDTGNSGRTGYTAMLHRASELLNASKKKITGKQRFEKAASGYHFEAVYGWLTSGRKGEDPAKRADALLRMYDQADDGIAAALAQGMPPGAAGHSVAEILAMPKHALKKLRGYFTEDTYRLLEDRVVYANLRDGSRPVLEEIASGAMTLADGLAAMQAALDPQAAAWGQALRHTMEHLQEAFLAQARFSGLDLDYYESLPAVSFRWQVFNREFNLSDLTPPLEDQLALDHASWRQGPNRNPKRGEIHMLDINGFQAPIHVINDMLYRLNMSPSYQAFRSLSGAAEHVGKTLQGIGGVFEDMAVERLGPDEQAAAISAGRAIALSGQEIIHKDSAKGGPRNVAMNVVQKFQQQGAVRALISFKQVWSQVLPAAIMYSALYGKGRSNFDYPALYLEYLYGLGFGKIAGLLGGAGAHSKSRSLADNINQFVLRFGANISVRTADGQDIYLRDVGRETPEAANRPRGRVSGSARPALDLVRLPFTKTGAAVMRASDWMLHTVLAKPESTMARGIFVHSLLQQVNAQRKDVGQPELTAHELVNPALNHHLALSPAMFQRASLAVTDMMAPTDSAEKALVFQQRQTALGEMFRGFLATFANHQIHTSGNSYAGWAMIRNGNPATRAEARRLIATNVSQNVLFQVMRYESIGLLLIAVIGLLANWDEDEKRDAYGRLYGIEPNEDEAARRGKLMRWVSLILGGSANPIGYNDREGEWSEEERGKDLKQMALMSSKELVNQVPFGGLGLLASTALGSTLNEYALKHTVMELLPGQLGFYERAGMVVPERWGGDGLGPQSESAMQRMLYSASQVFLNDIASRSTLTGGITSLVDPLAQISNAPEPVDASDASLIWMSQFPAMPRELRRVMQRPFLENTDARIWAGSWQQR